MKLLRPRTFVIFALAGLAGAVLLHTSQNVRHAEERLAMLERSVGREDEKNRMLKAEWETLNRPEQNGDTKASGELSRAGRSLSRTIHLSTLGQR